MLAQLFPDDEEQPLVSLHSPAKFPSTELHQNWPWTSSNAGPSLLERVLQKGHGERLETHKRHSLTECCCVASQMYAW